MSLSTKPSSPKKLGLGRKGVNLPKLDRIILKNGGNKGTVVQNVYMPVEDKGINLDMGALLRVEGRANHPKYD